MGDSYSDVKQAILQSDIRRMNLEGPFTVFGLFDVNMSTIMGFLSTCLSYLIILLQFK